MSPSPANEEAGGEPLAAIAALERELAGLLTRTRDEAERLIEEAGRNSRLGIDEARCSLPVVCSQLRESTLLDYRRRAEEHRSSWVGERDRLAARADAAVPETVDRLVSSFLRALAGDSP